MSIAVNTVPPAAGIKDCMMLVACPAPSDKSTSFQCSAGLAL